MAHESFEDSEVSVILNRHYISIKIDREERPDIDAVYMAVCQAVNGSGGWPMTLLMTPDQKPFYAATYLPKRSRYGMIGLIELLENMAEQWKQDKSRLCSISEGMTAYLNQQEKIRYPNPDPDHKLLKQGANTFRQAFDRQWGGFGNAPKFPTPHNLLFLLRYGALEQKSIYRQMAEHTLKQMYRGGIFDHIGGGFSRYSTDEKWLVPHFEKMLYDNALLAYSYLEAFHQTKHPLYERAARQILDYVLNELTDEQGGFYCGQDADSDGVEGKFYTFTPEELSTLLGKEASAEFCQWFGITKPGNFEGKNIPNLLDNPDFEKENKSIDALKPILYSYRLKRTHLHKDDKLLTSWNGLMIAAFSKAGRILHESGYLDAALKAQSFIQNHLYNEHGDLFIRWKDGDAAHPGQIDDYAFYTLALLEIYETTFRISYLKEAVRLVNRMLDLFWDNEDGGFYLYSKDSEALISRPKEVYDGAIPSGNSVAALLLSRLSRLTGDVRFLKYSERQFRFLAGRIQSYPAGYSFALLSLLEELYPAKELVCVVSDERDISDLQDYLRELYIPNLTILVKTPENEKELADLAGFTADYPNFPQNAGEGDFPTQESQVRYYLCQNGTCGTPVSNLEDLQKQLRT